MLEICYLLARMNRIQPFVKNNVRWETYSSLWENPFPSHLVRSDLTGHTEGDKGKAAGICVHAHKSSLRFPVGRSQRLNEGSSHYRESPGEQSTSDQVCRERSPCRISSCHITGKYCAPREGISRQLTCHIGWALRWQGLVWAATWQMSFQQHSPACAQEKLRKGLSSGALKKVWEPCCSSRYLKNPSYH